MVVDRNSKHKTLKLPKLHVVGSIPIARSSFSMIAEGVGPPAEAAGGSHRGGTRIMHGTYCAPSS